jgi:hypothetical protein
MKLPEIPQGSNVVGVGIDQIEVLPNSGILGKAR